MLFKLIFFPSNENEQLLGKFCGNLVNSMVHSLGHEMFIVFSTDSGGSAQGFQAEYRSEEPVTTGIVYRKRITKV